MTSSTAPPPRGPRPLPVTLVFGEPPVAIDARLLDADREQAQLLFVGAAPSALERGSGVVVRPDGERNLELVGTVDAIEGDRLRVKLSRAGHREDRWSPREKGQLRMRYQPEPEGFDAQAWAAGAPSPAGAWTEPDPRVELSLSGLAYLDTNRPEGRLLLSFVHEAREHRVVAEVVRTDPTRHEGVRKVALAFVHTPPPSGAALAEILVELQDAALEALSAPCTLDLPPPGSDVAEPGSW